MYVPTVNLAQRLGEIFFSDKEIMYFDIESNNSINSVSITIESSHLFVYFHFVDKMSYPDSPNELIIRNNFNHSLVCKINEYSKELYFNTMLHTDVGIEHEKIQAAIDEISKLDTPEYYHELSIRIE